jgi:hypothetical protein
VKSSAAVYNRLEIAAKRHDRRPLYDWLMRRTDDAVRDVIARTLTHTAEYRYGAQNRPPGYGATPKDILRVDPPIPGVPQTRHGVVVYARPLTDEEVRGYELAPYVPLAAIVARLMERVDRYGAQYADRLRKGDTATLRSGLGSTIDAEPFFTDIPHGDLWEQVAAALLAKYPAAPVAPTPAPVAVASTDWTQEKQDRLREAVDQGDRAAVGRGLADLGINNTTLAAHEANRFLGLIGVSDATKKKALREAKPAGGYYDVDDLLAALNATRATARAGSAVAAAFRKNLAAAIAAGIDHGRVEGARVAEAAALDVARANEALATAGHVPAWAARNYRTQAQRATEYRVKLEKETVKAWLASGAAPVTSFPVRGFAGSTLDAEADGLRDFPDEDDGDEDDAAIRAVVRAYEAGKRKALVVSRAEADAVIAGLTVLANTEDEQAEAERKRPVSKRDPERARMTRAASDGLSALSTRIFKAFR